LNENQDKIIRCAFLRISP